MKQQKECPKCHHFKLSSKRGIYLIVSAVPLVCFFISSIIALIMGSIGIALMIAFALIWIAFVITAFRSKMKHLQWCGACGYKFDDRALKSEPAKI